MHIIAIDPGPEKSAWWRQKGCYGSTKVDGLTQYQRYYKRHQEARRADARKRRREHKPERAAYMRRYRKSRPDIFKAIEQKRIRPAGRREQTTQYHKEWNKKNPDKRLASYQARRAKLGEVSIPSRILTKIRKNQNGLCYYCGKSLDNNGRGHLEHKIPLSRDGAHVVENIVFSCSSCNLRKGTKTAEEFLCLSSQ